MRDLAAVAPDPFDRTHYELGDFAASGFVVHPNGDRVLLIHYVKFGAWVQSGGYVGLGDPSAMAAVMREITEETGVAALTPVTESVIDIDIHMFPARPEQPEHRHYNIGLSSLRQMPIFCQAMRSWRRVGHR